jgi:glycerophosphoryl diester phosphodiesterase
VEAGVPVVEIDLRGARDGELFVMHDGRLEEATTGQGRVEATPAAEVAAARLGNGETVPRFPEIYAISRGRAVLSVDFKTEPGAIERVAEWVHAQGSFDDLIFFANTIEEMQAAARARQRYPAIILMVRLLDTRVTVDTTRMVMGRLPDIFHTERVGSAEVARLHALGAKVYMSALPLDRYVQPLRALAFWWLLRARADFVLTGDPLALMRRVGAE